VPPAEVPKTTEGLIHTARFERLFPCEGGMDMHTLLAACRVGAKEHARLAISAARHHLDSVHARGAPSHGKQARTA